MTIMFRVGGGPKRICCAPVGRLEAQLRVLTNSLYCTLLVRQSPSTVVFPVFSVLLRSITMANTLYRGQTKTQNYL